MKRKALQVQAEWCVRTLCEHKLGST